MALPSALGIYAGPPFGNYLTRYPAAVANNTDFVNIIGDNFSRMRAITKTTSTTETAINPGGTDGYAPAYRYWVLSVKAAYPNMFILYGIDPGSPILFNPPYFSFYKGRMVIEAQWAQDNAMDAFSVGNEHEVGHFSAYVQALSLTRTSNVVTAVFSTAHGFTTGEDIAVYGSADTSFNVNDPIATASGVTCTVIDSLTLTYPKVGADGSGTTGPFKVGWSYHQERLKVKECAVAAQAVFTRGDISYSCSQDYQSGWITDGITPGTDLDKIGFNIYGTAAVNNNFSSFKTTLDTCWATFGTNMIMTELNASDPGTWNNSLLNTKTPSTLAFNNLWETEMLRRYRYASNLGVTQIYFYTSWDIQNNFSIYYNNGSDNGQPTSVLDLNATFTGYFKPIVKKLGSRRPDTVMLGSVESQ